MMDSPWTSRRSPVYCRNGMVACSQPLAAEAGLSILKRGGNAVDAAVGVAAALNVTQPTSTGIGGDAFMLYYDAKEKKVHGLNGRAAALWVDAVTLYGSGTLKLLDVLDPAITLATQGYPVAPICSQDWQISEKLLQTASPNGGEMLREDLKAPKPGEIMKMPELAETFRALGTLGRDGFYKGRVAKAMVDVVKDLGGFLSLEDLEKHETTKDEPIRVNYRGVDVYEMPPNGQGITALLALNILEGFDLSKLPHNSKEHLHLLTECLRLSFTDARYYVADPKFSDVPVKGMLDKDYANERRKLISQEKANLNIEHGFPSLASSTVYFCVVDGEGNACSFINSNYQGFGTGIVPKGCGFTLHNRGDNFSLDEGHPNSLQPGKRPYHTIIPGLALKDGDLYAAFGVMGGFMQPQGHVQVISNMVDFSMNPQQALDAPRLQISGGSSQGQILLEEGIEDQVRKQLEEMGHKEPIILKGWARATFGVGQIIRRDKDTGVLEGGGDPRHDGHAIGW